jgi:hypothetical protein
MVVTKANREIEPARRIVVSSDVQHRCPSAAFVQRCQTGEHKVATQAVPSKVRIDAYHVDLA